MAEAAKPALGLRNQAMGWPGVPHHWISQPQRARTSEHKPIRYAASAPR